MYVYYYMKYRGITSSTGTRPGITVPDIKYIFHLPDWPIRVSHFLFPANEMFCPSPTAKLLQLNAVDVVLNKHLFCSKNNWRRFIHIFSVFNRRQLQFGSIINKHVIANLFKVRPFLNKLIRIH